MVLDHALSEELENAGRHVHQSVGIHPGGELSRCLEHRQPATLHSACSCMAKSPAGIGVVPFGT